MACVALHVWPSRMKFQKRVNEGRGSSEKSPPRGSIGVVAAMRVPASVGGSVGCRVVCVDRCPDSRLPAVSGLTGLKPYTGYGSSK